MTIEIWTSLIAAVGAIAAASIPFLFRIMKRKREEDAKRSIAELYTRRERVYMILRDMLRKTSAHRVLIMRSENGGGVPQTGSPIHVSVVFEDHDGELPSIRTDWQRRSISKDYEVILHQMISEGGVIVKTSSLNTGDDLYSLYKSQGIQRAELFRIGISKGKLVLYLSMLFKDDVPMTHAERASVHGSLSRLRNLFDKDDNMIVWEGNKSESGTVRLV